MAERYTLARPYAEALVKQAGSDDELRAQWSQALATLSTIVANDTVKLLLGDPRIAQEELVSAIIEIGSQDFGQQARNLVHLLASNDRLWLVPEIAELYELERARVENRVHVEVTTATRLLKKQRDALGEALKSRLGREVTLKFRQDKQLISGALIRAGDLVIDGTLKGRLEQMRQTIAH